MRLKPGIKVKSKNTLSSLLMLTFVFHEIEILLKKKNEKKVLSLHCLHSLPGLHCLQSAESALG